MNTKKSVESQLSNNVGPSKMSPETRSKLFKLLIQLSLKTLEGKPIGDGALEKVNEKVGPVPNVYELFAGVHELVRSYLRQPQGSIKVETLRENLKESKFNIPEDCISDLVNTLSVNRAIFDDNISRDSFYLKLVKLRWRVDITISSSVLSRVLEPCILMEFQFNNSKKKMCEVSISKFHELRFNVASVLKEMEIIEKKKMFKKAII